SVDHAFLDVLPESDVSFGRTASGKDRRVAGFEKCLHLGLLVGSGIDVPVSVNEPGHRRHALGIDGRTTRGGQPAWRHRNDFARAYHNRPAIYYRSISDNDASISDRKVLCREGRKCPEHQAGKYRQRVSFHAGSSSEACGLYMSVNAT